MTQKIGHLLILLLFSLALQAQNTFECNGELILSLSSNGPTIFYRIDITPGGNVVFNPIGMPNSDVGINGIGYRTTDNLVYGLQPIYPQRLYRLNTLGELTQLAILDDLTDEYGYFAGAISPDGDTFVVLGSGGNPFRNFELAIIDLTDPDYALDIYPLSTTTGNPVAVTDIAFDPISGDLFGFDSFNDRLILFDLDNYEAIDNLYPTVDNVTAIGANFFDAFGQMWAYGNVGQEPSQTLFKVDIQNGHVTEVANGPVAFGKDGCSCPFTIQLQKSVNTSTAVPCTTVEYTFTMTNQTGIAQSGIHFEDVLPVDLTISEIIRNPFGGNILSGVGSSHLSIENMLIPLGIDSLVVKVEIGEAALGLYRNQARLNNLPENLGGQTLSDDPRTFTSMDSTDLFIEPLMVNFIEETVDLCPGDSVLLDVSSYGVQYEWNEGTTEPALTITEQGLYSVTISSGCDQVVDGITVRQDNKILDLGPDQSIELGDSIRLSPFLAGFVNPVFHWLATEDLALSCVTCPEPIARPVEDGTYWLEVAGEGSDCSEQDSVDIQVIKNREVFVPNVFSPNNDGLNDYFFLQSKWPVQVNQLRIYNRWGALVFELKNKVWTNDPSVGWNGLFNDRWVSNGVFVWVAEVEYLDGVVDRLSGDLTVLK